MCHKRFVPMFIVLAIVALQLVSEHAKAASFYGSNPTHRRRRDHCGGDGRDQGQGRQALHRPAGVGASPHVPGRAHCVQLRDRRRHAQQSARDRGAQAGSARGRRSAGHRRDAYHAACAYQAPVDAAVFNQDGRLVLGQVVAADRPVLGRAARQGAVRVLVAGFLRLRQVADGLQEVDG